MNSYIHVLCGANLDIDLATPAGQITWQQQTCPWNEAEQTTEHRCAVKNTSLCPYFCGIRYPDAVLCCHPEPQSHHTRTRRMLCEITGPSLGQAAGCEAVLQDLPDWFGIESANQHYLQAIDSLPTFIASLNGQVVGFLTVKQHFSRSAEIYVMGVRPEHHRQGLGRALLAAAEADLRQHAVQYLQVKTLSANHPDPGYAQTRAFYLATGFSPLEELPNLWGEANPCLLLVKQI